MTGHRLGQNRPTFGSPVYANRAGTGGSRSSRTRVDHAACPRPIALPSQCSSSDREIALVYFPGALVDADFYKPLSEAIQSSLEQCGVALHVVIPSYPVSAFKMMSEAYQRTCAMQMLEIALEELRANCGFEGGSDDLFLAGHSMGSVLASFAAFHDPSSTDGEPLAKPRCRAISIHGGYIRPQFNNATDLRAAPTSEINGERDGLIRLTNFASRRAVLTAELADPAELARCAPLVILPGVSHGTFSNGGTNDFAGPRDLPHTIPHSTGIAAVADATAKFLLMSGANMPAAEAEAAEAFFAESTQRDTARFCDVYTEALRRDTSGDTCRDIQRLLLGQLQSAGRRIEPRCTEDVGFAEETVSVLQPRTWNTLPQEDPETPFVEHDWAFLSSKPRLFCSDGEGKGEQPSVVQVWPQCSTAQRRPGLFEYTSQPGAPTKMRCKLKSGHSVATALESGVGISPGGPEYEGPPPPRPAADARSSAVNTIPPEFADMIRAEVERLDPFTVARINEHVLLSVLRRLPQHVQELYERSPRRLEFGADIHAQSAPDWAASELLFEDVLEGSGGEAREGGPAEAGGVLLRSQRTTVPPGDTRFDGMFYCTVLSEAQAFEYIMYESQKGAGIAIDAEGMLVQPHAQT